MLAADPPAIVQPSQPEAQPDVIEVVGTRADQAQKIDRRTYRVNDTPHSQQKDAIQLLRGLPAVTVAPDDTINLLGNSNVKIYVDGRPYAGADARAFLRTLHGSDVERIEVITNPSAQYSAEGTAGILNFVLRTKRREGISGTASAEASTFGHGEVGTSITDTKGQWTYELQAEGTGGRTHPSTYQKRRSVEQTPGGIPTVNTETGGGPSRSSGGFVSGKVTYQIDPKTSISAMVAGEDWRSGSTNNARFRGLTTDFSSFSERQRFTTLTSSAFAQLALNHRGSKEGETLIASLFVVAPTQHERNDAAFSNGGALSTDKRKRFLFADGRIDWQHPMGTGEILSIGGSWNYNWMSERYAFTSVGTGSSLGGNASDQFSGAETTLSGYATFQQPIGTWTVMPGLRFEQDSQRISSPGQADVRKAHTQLFPSFHLDHPLGKTLDLTLSYSKRIDRPPLNDLRPYPLVQDVKTMKIGNPHLKDQSTDSYELNLHYHRKKVDAGLILYDRATAHLWNQNYTAVNGITVLTTVNAGHRIDRGAEVDVSTPLVSRVKMMESVNLFDERSPVDLGGEMKERFRYTSNATVEWDGRDRGKIPGDVAQLQWLYFGAHRDFQIESFASNWLSLSYTHSFTQTLSLTGTVDYAGLNRHRLVAPLVQEFYRQRSPMELKLKLLKTFGNPKAASQPTAPPVPVPH